MTHGENCQCELVMRPGQQVCGRGAHRVVVVIPRGFDWPLTFGPWLRAHAMTRLFRGGEVVFRREAA